MDAGDFLDWLVWVILSSIFLTLVLVAAAVLIMAVAEVVFFLRRRRRGNKLPPPSIEQLMDSIPDILHQQLPGQGGSCVICMAPYELGERCSVLPGCAHVFHKDCAAGWLRRHSTCPLCRAAVAVAAEPGGASENMV